MKGRWPAECGIETGCDKLMKTGENGKNIETRKDRNIKEAGNRRGTAKNGTFRRWEYAASYTVETACVMAVFCMAMVILIQQAYRLHDETKSGMNLQEAVEAVRHDEDDRLEEIEEQFQNNPEFLLSMEQTDLQIRKGIGRIYGEASGQQESGRWGLEISSRIYEPEEFLRQVAALKQLEERHESQLQEGDAP
ncbi:MAG: hypothetical protein Q4F29_01450 [Lachnospiraceae bacterium]|nr:hypothetical protein [Lachnospiraceae bacterium]